MVQQQAAGGRVSNLPFIVPVSSPRFSRCGGVACADVDGRVVVAGGRSRKLASMTTSIIVAALGRPLVGRGGRASLRGPVSSLQAHRTAEPLLIAAADLSRAASCRQLVSARPLLGTGCGLLKKVSSSSSTAAAIITGQAGGAAAAARAPAAPTTCRRTCYLLYYYTFG